MGKVHLKPSARSLVGTGVLTIYSKWIEKVEDANRGDYVEVYLEGELVGSGFYEDVGAVGVRLILSGDVKSVEEAIVRRLEEAYRLRRLLLNWDSYRLVNADGDHLPGLIIDVYKDIVVIQSSSIGFDRHINIVLDWVIERLKPRMVYLRNDQRSRREAGLPVERRIIYGGGSTTTIIEEGEARFLVDVDKGQKTGFFLDQRINRLKLGEIVWEGARVLDLYSYTGGFAIHALLNGASKAILVEESEYAVEGARANLKLNGLQKSANVIMSRVEDFLRRDHRRYDIIVSDPPALIPNRESKVRGLEAYRRLYHEVISKVEPGGVLVASSCSYFLDLKELLEILRDAALAHNREAKILWIHGASPDHISRPQDQFLRYLKVVFLAVE